MSALFVVLMFVAFVALDFAVREFARRHREKRAKLEREAVLEVAVRMDYSAEAKSLKRVEVPEPKARILAVDDESVVLDSFRRILVIEGFSVDTVENGLEALGLLRTHDYDFLFTDLKMPEMDGVEVVKAAKHIRPDIDVVVITGFGTIETAVETLQHGACEYVQKPFTAEELGDFARRLLIKRQARLESQTKPNVHVVAPGASTLLPPQDYCVPGGAFLSPEHTWARIEPSGEVRIGLDDFARKCLGTVTALTCAHHGDDVRRGETLFTLSRGTERLAFPSPFTGKVTTANREALEAPVVVTQSPYEQGWICRLQPSDLAEELPALHIGKAAVGWYQEEIARLPKGQDVDWTTFRRLFLTRE